MESPKGPTKECKTAFKILIRSQNSSHFLQNSIKNSKLKDKTQELGISLTPSCQNNGQKTTLAYTHCLTQEPWTVIFFNFIFISFELENCSSKKIGLYSTN